MAYPVTLNGRTYTLADFEGQNYVDGLPDAFEDFVTQAGNIYNTTSTSSVAIGTGSKTFTVADSGKPYIVGTPLRIADTAAPSTNWIDGIVTSYSGTTLVVDAVAYAGSGTKTSWNINIGGGPIAYTGTLPIAQGGTGGTTAAAARTNLDTYSKSEADSRFLNVSGEASDVTMTGNVTIGDAASDELAVNAVTRIGGSQQRGNSLFNVGGDQTNVLAVSRTDIGQPDTSGDTSIWFGDSGSGIPAITRRKTSINTTDMHFYGEYGYNVQDERLVLSRQSQKFITVGYDAAEFGSGGTTINGDSQDRDFRIKSQSDSDAFVLDGNSGNVLISKSTAAGVSTAGIELRNDGVLVAAKSGGTTSYFGRIGGSGEITQYYQDSSHVGTISTSGANTLNIGSSDTAIQFDASTNQIKPFRIDTASTSANTIDLGSSGASWRDMHLYNLHYIHGGGGSDGFTPWTIRAHHDGGGGGVFPTMATGKAQMGELYAYDTSNGNWCHYSLKKDDGASSIQTQQISGTGLTVTATNSGGTIAMSNTSTDVKFVVSIYIVEP